MEITLTKGSSEKNTPSQDIPSRMKKTYQITIAKLVPVFAARWHSICKYVSKHSIGKTKQEDQQQ